MYHFQSGQNLSVTGAVTMSGPQAEDQIPQLIKELLNDPEKRITRVIIEHKDLNVKNEDEANDGYFWSYSKGADV